VGCTEERAGCMPCVVDVGPCCPDTGLWDEGTHPSGCRDYCPWLLTALSRVPLWEWPLAKRAASPRGSSPTAAAAEGSETNSPRFNAAYLKGHPSSSAPHGVSGCPCCDALKFNSPLYPILLPLQMLILGTNLTNFLHAYLPGVWSQEPNLMHHAFAIPAQALSLYA